MVITRTEGELVMIDIFGTHTPLYLLQLFLEASRRIAETLENTRDGTHIAIFVDNTLTIVGRALTL